MRIRRLDIEHFRGIEHLSWVVPDQSFFALVGPGDATKSTILTAIERCLSDRWNIAFQDTDFYNADVSVPISLRITVANLPDGLLALDEFGRYLCGIDGDGRLSHDPEDGAEPCVVAELRVDSDLEPQWLFWRPDDPDRHALKASLRAQFGVYRVDERVDTHLRWSRMSALGKLTESRHGTKRTLTEAARAAKDAVANNLNADLVQLAQEIRDQVQQLGSAEFADLKPGLDMSLTNSQGNLALYDGPIPLMNFGLGTRRLAGAATQQLAHNGSAMLLVDEVEYGLEPHRLVHLLTRLRNAKSYAQVFVTTHSPTALQHLDAKELVTVRSRTGATSMAALGCPAQLQPIVRRWPEAFLSRRVVVTEGKTEFGLLLVHLEAWDQSAPVPSAALGVTPVEGAGSQNPDIALSLLAAGYEVSLFMDSDDVDAVARVREVEAAGGVVVRWEDGLNTESAICNDLDATGMTGLLAAAIAGSDTSNDPQAIFDQLLHYNAPRVPDQREVLTWLSEEFTIDQARTTIAVAASEGKWFKRVDKGRLLGRFVMNEPALATGSVATVLSRLKSAVYDPRPEPERGPRPRQPADDETNADKNGDGEKPAGDRGFDADPTWGDLE